MEALDGAPGIYSARWAGPAKDFAVAMRRVADELRQRGGWKEPGPRANFIAVLCLAWPDGEVALFEGKVYGHLVWPPRGDKGFGYDPMFVPDGDKLTFGEMEPDAKHAISHRARAFALFARACLGDGAPAEARRLRRLRPLAVLRLEVPLLRLQQPRAGGRHRRGALPARLPARAAALGGAGAGPRRSPASSSAAARPR